MKGLFLSIFLIAAPVTALHAAPATANLYEIEVIVFQNRLSELEGGETWTRGPEKTAAAGKDETAGTGERPPEDSTLSAAAAALEKSGRHHVLAHLRWQQSAEAKSVSKPVRIGSAAGELDGSLRFYLSRFLILELNLALRDMRGGETPENTAVMYQLNEPRRIKVSETHYFDHPKFGALVRVTQARQE